MTTYTYDEYKLQLGGLWGNFHTLEFIIRLFLCEKMGIPIRLPKQGDFSIEVTPITKHTTINGLIGEYNKSLSLKEEEFKVEENIIGLRNAFAHGRVFGLAPLPPFRLLNKPVPDKAGKIQNFDFDETLDKKFLGEKIDFVYEQIQKVSACAKKRGYKSIDV